MSLPITTFIPATDEARIRSLLKALAGGSIPPIEFAERVYKIGKQAYQRGAADPDAQLSERAEIFDLSRLEKFTIARALAKCNGKKLEAARLLGIGKTTLYRKIAAYDIERRKPSSCL